VSGWQTFSEKALKTHWWGGARRILVTLVLSGCGSLASRDLFPEISARQVPVITLSEIIDLLPEPVETSAILLRANGTAAVVTVDSQQQLHYIAVANHGAVTRENLGKIENGSPPRLDIIEHRGQLRVLAGDKQFSRGASDSAWKETGGNRCAKFLPLDDALFCAMVIKGEEIKSPERKDWTVGWFIMFPVVFWSNQTAAKLVIAQELPQGWLIRAVVDGESPLDAGMDFFAATDPSGQLELLYSASRGGGLFGVFVGTAPGAAATGFSGYTPELRYARFALRELLPTAKDANRSEAPDRLDPRLLRSSVRVEDAPTVTPGDRVHPLHRRFATSHGPGVLHGILWAREMPRPSNSSAFSSGAESGWLNVQLDNGVWNPRMDVVAVEEIPDETFTWAMNDRFAVMASSAVGNSQALIETCSIGFWDSTCRVAYFVRTSSQWSAPQVLGGASKFDYDGRALAIGDRGCSFATWVTADGKFVGRWIGRCDPVTTE